VDKESISEGLHAERQSHHTTAVMSDFCQTHLELTVEMDS
jgi:hypothetical protein